MNLRRSEGADDAPEGKRQKYEHGARYFAAGIRANPEDHYYVTPEVTVLLRDLIQGKYCILTGHRQSGKSTSITYAVSQVAERAGVLPIMLSRGLPGAQKSWKPEDMWQRLCKLLHLACRAKFPKMEDGRIYNEDDFVEAFNAENLKVRVLLVIDEADTLLKLNEGCIDALMHNVRVMKQESGMYNIKGMVLVGTDRVKDLIEMRYHEAAKQPGYEPSRTTPSIYSPFPHDHAPESIRFVEQDIRALLEQYAADYEDAGVQVQEIAESIFQLTSGHKGLVGTCLAFMDQEKAFSLPEWNQLAANNSLATHVFSLATYSRVMQAVRETDSKTLKQFLELQSVRCDLSTGPVEYRGLLASGVLIMRVAAPYCYMTLSSPLLRMAILGRLSVYKHNLGKQAPRPRLQTEADRVWVLEAALELLDGNILPKSPEVWLNNDTPSEYSYQFAFMARLKMVLEQAYPSMQLKVLPEVREVREPGLQRSLLRAVSLVVDGDEFQRFAAEFLVTGTAGVTGTLRKHYLKALAYAEQHSALVYLVNLTMDEEFNELVPESPTVVFVGVEFKSEIKSARVKMIYADETRHEVILPLKRWTGELIYHFA